MDELIKKLEDMRRNIDILKAHHDTLNDIDPAGRAQRNTKMLMLIGQYEQTCDKVKAHIVAGRKVAPPEQQRDLFDDNQKKLETDDNAMWVRAQTIVAGWIATVLGNTYDKDN